MEVLQELLWAHIFMAPIPFKRYQNTSGCDTAKRITILENSTIVTLRILTCFPNIQNTLLTVHNI